MNDVKKYLRYLKRRSQIKISDDYESKKNKLVNDPKYIRIMFVMNEILFESFPQLVLQSAFLYQDIITDRTVTTLKIQQIISICLSLISISFNCMIFLREVASQKMKINISKNMFCFTRSFSNMFLVISRVIPLSLIFTKTIWIVPYGLIRFILYTLYSYKFEIFNFKLENNKSDKTKKIGLAVALSVIKSVTFFEEFELTKSYIFYHFYVLFENISIFFLFCYLDSYNGLNQLILYGSLIIFCCFLFGLIIEIIHWKILVSHRTVDSKKFNITDISEHVNLYSLLKEYVNDISVLK